MWPNLPYISRMSGTPDDCERDGRDKRQSQPRGNPADEKEDTGKTKVEQTRKMKLAFRKREREHEMMIRSISSGERTSRQ